VDGVLLVDKPSGPTSFDVVRRTRKLAATKRVGHTGTLDPLASGLLTVCLGTHTRLVPYLMESEKRYEALVSLGAATDTDDSEGEVIARADVPPLTREIVEAALGRFAGEISQLPPAYSALKIDGQPAYERARRGEEVAIAPRLVRIYGIDLVALEPFALRLDVRCGAGTYIRSLARDLGAALGTLGHIEALRRTEGGGFRVDEAIRFDDLEPLAAKGALEGRLLKGTACLRHMPQLVLNDEDAAAIACGRSIEIPPKGVFSRAALLAPDGALLAIGRAEGSRLVCERGFPR